MDIKNTGVGLIIGVILTATSVALIPTSESPTYATTQETIAEEQKIKVSRTICEPFEYTATKNQIVEYANRIQYLLDTNAVTDDLSKTRLERVKSRFIQDVEEINKLR